MTAAVPTMSYETLATQLRASGYIADPWYDGKPRFRKEPLLLTPSIRDALYACAEAVASVYDELCRLCQSNPEWLETFFGLTPWQRAMWEASAPAWHGIARADVFLTSSANDPAESSSPESRGVVACELNSDTPSGEAEAVVLNALVRGDYPHCTDPNAALGDTLCTALAAFRSLMTGRVDAEPRIGIVYPTEMTEDLSMVLLYRDWFERHGFRVVLGSPYNLSRVEADAGEGETVGMFGKPCDVIVRHYKTDWWGERVPVWADAPPFPDAEPLRRPLSLLLEASVKGSCAVWNPFGSVLAQNKKAMAFMWERRELFSRESRAVIERHIPFTTRLETADFDDLRARPDQWVLKSDYGCEGDEVVMGNAVDPSVWTETLVQALPKRWVAQRCFSPLVDEEGHSVNHGVYLVAGRAAGIFSRIERGMTDEHAVSAPTLVLP